MSHWISVIRFVPDPARGEFVNVAAIAGDDDSEDLEIRSVGNWKRAKGLDTRSALRSVMDFVSGLQERVDISQFGDIEGLSITRDIVEAMSGEMQNIVQVTRPVPVRAGSVKDAVDLAFKELIIDPASPTFDFPKKLAAQKALRAAYKARDVPVQSNARVRSGPYDTSFDFAVANGKAVQLVGCFSFQLPDQHDLAEKIRAWAWGVRAIRLGGGSDAVFKSAGSVSVPSDVDIEAVFVPPAIGQKSKEAFEVAREIFADPGASITAVPMDNALVVASRAVDFLTHSIGTARV